MIPNWLEVLGYSAGGLISVSTIYRLAVRPIARTIKTLDRQYEAVQIIAREFYPNRGASLKDYITRIEGQLIELSDHQKRQHHQQLQFESYVRGRIHDMANFMMLGQVPEANPPFPQEET